MISKTRLLLAAALALIALSAAATTANAASFSISPTGAITSISLGLLSFSSSVATVTCRVTLRGSLNPGLIPKTAGTEFGKVTEGSTNNRADCNEPNDGIPLVSSASPWRLSFESILGTLPSNVRGILFLIERGAFEVRVSGVECLYEGNINALMAVTGNGEPNNPYKSGLIEILKERGIPKHSGSFLCPAEGKLLGQFGIRPQLLIIRL